MFLKDFGIVSLFSILIMTLFWFIMSYDDRKRKKKRKKRECK